MFYQGNIKFELIHGKSGQMANATGERAERQKGRRQGLTARGDDMLRGSTLFSTVCAADVDSAE